MKHYIFILSLLCLLASVKSFSQTPGIIVRPAGNAGPAALDSNADGYTSATTAGFGTDDILNSEVPYKIVPPVIAEPTGDLLRGPSGKYTDIVKKTDGSGFYLYNDGTNLLCRIRIGGIVSGSKGYSILLDTDGKFGNSGTDADPNYLPATNGNNGNPGFEREVVLETNFRIAVYNVDGTSTPVLITSYPISTNSQISVAATTDGGNADYFYDFYVPFSAIGITSSTPLRATATTVMSPQPAIGGPKSDIYGVSGDDYMADWVTAISSQPVFTLDSLASTGSGVSALCTAAPFLNGPILPTASSVTGTWSKSANSPVSTATINLYKGGVLIGSTTVSSGGTWTINVSGLLNNDILTAKAQAAGESMCFSSNSEKVNACNSSNIPATPVLTCSSGSKGINGTNLASGWTIHADNITRNTANNNVTNTGGLFGANSGVSPNITWQYSGGCSTGSPLTSGSYKIYYTNNTTGCNSQPAYFCAAGNGPNALAGSLSAPAITSPSNGVYTPATNSISGTTTVSASLSLFINGLTSQTTTATAGGLFTFSNLALLAGQQIYISAEKNTGAVSTSYCAVKSTVSTVLCYTNPPLITVGNSNKLTTGLAITGTSSETSGTTIRVYNSANALVATTAVQNDGTWSTANAGTTPATYTAAASTSYYANAQNGTCGISTNSATFSAAGATSLAICGSVPATVNENATTVSGTLSATPAPNTIVTLYEDGIAIGADTTSIAAWGPIPVNDTVSNALYAGGLLTIGIAEPLKNEVTCGATITISCAPPSAPAISPSDTTIMIGDSVTYTISTPQSGILYSLKDDQDTVNIGSSKFGSGSSVTIVSEPFNTVGSYDVNVKATSFSGANCNALTMARVVVAAALPVSLVTFEGKYDKGVAKLKWNTSSEQNLGFFELQKSYTEDNFKKEVIIKSSGNSQGYQAYKYNDSSIAAPVVYYRLKMTDKDKGHTAYSNIVALHVDIETAFSAVSPNPFSDVINFSVEMSKDAPLTISLTDMAGRKIRTINYAAKKGSNNISLSGLGGVLKGTYLAEINAAEQNVSRQIIIKQ